MIHRPSRRDVVKAAAKVAAIGVAGHGPAGHCARPGADPVCRRNTLRYRFHAPRCNERRGGAWEWWRWPRPTMTFIYEGIFGRRRLPEGPAMTRDTVFRVASMVKLMTSVAALQLVERGKLSLDAPVPDLDSRARTRRRSSIDSMPRESRTCARPKRPISLRDLLTHTAGFSYRLWDAKAVQYREGRSISCRRRNDAEPRARRSCSIPASVGNTAPASIGPAASWSSSAASGWMSIFASTSSTRSA